MLTLHRFVLQSGLKFLVMTFLRLNRYLSSGLIECRQKLQLSVAFSIISFIHTCVKCDDLNPRYQREIFTNSIDLIGCSAS